MSYSQFEGQGTLSQYKYLHKWMGDKHGRAKYCEDCQTTSASRYDWACITGIYNREIENWKRLCRSCHQKRDAHLFRGKRFSGKKHSEESKLRASEAMKRQWRDNGHIWAGKMRNQWTGPAK